MSGRILRLKRFQTSPDGRMVIFPLDHGVSCGPLPGLERLDSVIRMGVQEGADALVLHKGMLRFLEDLPGRLPGIFLHLSASTQLGSSHYHKILIGTVEEAVRRGVDGVSIHINLGNDREPEMLRDFGMVSDACAEWQIPLLVMIYVSGLKEAAIAPDWPIAHAARIAAELGADIIKIPLPKDDRILEEITSSLPVPVVIAGGSKTTEASLFLERVEKAMKAGARGVAIGRNVFQSEQPEMLLRAVRSIVHEGFSARDAWEEIKRGQAESSAGK
jgi:predicted phospho-2-dehydro-3-deoxyheptonate aldolase